VVVFIPHAEAKTLQMQSIRIAALPPCSRKVMTSLMFQLSEPEHFFFAM